MNIRKFILVVACLCFSLVGQSAPKKTTKRKTAKVIRQKAKKVAKAGQLLPNGAPPAGLYEVRLSFSGNSREDHMISYPSYSDFKWLRLYKNGTYKTNLTKKGRVEGRYIFKPKTKEIIWKVFHPDKHTKTSKDIIKVPHPEDQLWYLRPEDYLTGFITDGTSANCNSGPQEKCVVSWVVRHFESFGSTDCYWKRP